MAEAGKSRRGETGGWYATVVREKEGEEAREAGQRVSGVRVSARCTPAGRG